jgi:protein gp37
MTMSKPHRSKIGYADFSGGDANFIIGCTPASAGCINCYARELIEVRQGRDFSKIRLYPEKLHRLGRTKFEENGVLFRRGPGSRPIVFPVDLGDIMHADVPQSFISDALNLMAGRDEVDWLILTKRSRRS